jgi:hypothetical protein
MALDLFGDFGFVGGSDETAARYQDAQRCINYFPEVSPSPVAKVVTALLGTPGLIPLVAGTGGGIAGYTADNNVLTADADSFVLNAWNPPSEITNLPVRGSWVLPGRKTALVVIGNRCYLATAVAQGSNTSPGSITLTQVGTLLTSAGPVVIRDNGIQGGAAVIVDGPYGYLYQTSGNPASVSVLGIVTPGSTIVSCETTTGLIVGAQVTDSDNLLPAGTVLESVDITGSMFTLSNPISGSPISVATTSATGAAATVAITKISVSGNVMTVQFAAQPSAPPVGSSLEITGVVPAAYNGVYGVISSGVSYITTTTSQSAPVSQLGSILLEGISTIGFATQPAAPPVGGNVTVSAMNPESYDGTYSIIASTTSSVSYLSFGSGSQINAGQVSWGETVATDTFTMTTPVFTQILDPAFLGSDTVAYIDGWWIFNQPGTALFYSNASAYSQAFNGSYYAYKDAFSDALMAVIENKEELWLIGEETTEIWYNAGGQFFPFQRLVGTLLQMGCSAKHSVCQLSQGSTDSLIWLGRNVQGENVIVRTSGFSWDVVSTPAVSNAIAQYSTVSDAQGYVYQEGAHEFYVLTFPTADRTWVYDATLPPHLAWHERLSYDPYADQWHRHRSNCFMNFAGMRVVGDYENGVLYQMTRAAYSDAGWPIRAVRRSPYIWNAQNRERVFMQQLQIDFRLGQGNASGLGTNPLARLRISRDYGATYGAPVTAPMGAQGEYLDRCIWRRLGFSRGAVAEIEVIDPVNRDITGATLRAQGP